VCVHSCLAFCGIYLSCDYLAVFVLSYLVFVFSLNPSLPTTTASKTFEALGPSGQLVTVVVPPDHYQGMTVVVECPEQYPAKESVYSQPAYSTPPAEENTVPIDYSYSSKPDRHYNKSCVCILLSIGGVFALIGIVLLGVGIPKAASADELNAAEDFIDLNVTCEVTAENYYYDRDRNSRSESYKVNGQTFYRTVYDISCDDCYKWEGIRNVSDALYSPAITEPLRFYNQCKTRKSVRGAHCNEPYSLWYSELCEECPAGSPWPGSLEVGEIVQCWIAKNPRTVPDEYVCENSLCS
jgi:hypothetical protein